MFYEPVCIWSGLFYIERNTDELYLFSATSDTRIRLFFNTSKAKSHSAHLRSQHLRD